MLVTSKKSEFWTGWWPLLKTLCLNFVRKGRHITFRALCETFAPLREKTGTLLSEKRYLDRVILLFLPYCTRCWKQTCHVFFTTRVPIFAQRRGGFAENAEGIKGELLLFLRSDNAISSAPRGMQKTDLSPFFYSLRIHFRAETRRLRRERGGGERGIVTSWKTIPLQSDTPISPAPRGMLKTDLSLSKNSETLKGGNCIVSRVMWAMVKQSDNRSCFHTESRPITFRAHCETFAPLREKTGMLLPEKR